MTRYVLTKFLEAVISIWGVMTIVFFVTRLLGDPVTLLVPVGTSTAEMDTLRAQLGLDQPLIVQYLSFLGDVLRGDFGDSFVHNRPAAEVILERMPATIQLASAALQVEPTLPLRAMNGAKWQENKMLLS